jgi:hypothetical protein
MTVLQRLASLERGANRTGGDLITAPLSDDKKHIKMNYYLLMHDEEGALDYARQLHRETEERPRTPPLITPELERELDRRLVRRRDADNRAPEERERDRREHEAREARAKEILAAAGAG